MINNRNHKIGCCGVFTTLAILFLCMVLGSCFLPASAQERDCDSYLLLVPGEPTRTVSVIPAEGDYLIAKTDGVLAIWKFGGELASLRIGDDTYHAKIGFSNAEGNYCGMIMLEIQDQFIVEDPWTMTKDY